jgi:hypothetical protein
MGTSALIAGALASAYGAAKLVAPKSPLSPGAPPVMPDQTSVLQSQQLEEAKAAALQEGRAATVLTGTGAASNTGDKLGP